MHWTNQYIGIPFSNMNCGELAVCIQREVFGRTFERTKIPATENPFEYSKIVRQGMLDYLTDKILHPVEGCCVLMKAMKRLSHVGVYTKIGSREYVIHSVDSFKSSMLHQVKDLKIYGYEVEGYYAWK